MDDQNRHRDRIKGTIIAGACGFMVSCVRNGGDTDSIASIAGNFFGALNGFSAIPLKYVINLQDSQKIQKLADEYAGLIAE